MVSRNRGTLTFKGLNYMSHIHTYSKCTVHIHTKKTYTKGCVCVCCLFLTHMHSVCLCCATPQDRLSVQIKWPLNLCFNLRGGGGLEGLMTTSPTPLSLSFPLSAFHLYPSFIRCFFLSVYTCLPIHLIPDFHSLSNFLSLSLSLQPQNQFSGGHCRADL